MLSIDGMRPLVLIGLLAGCSAWTSDKRIRIGHYSRDVYEGCMRKNGADPASWEDFPERDRGCVAWAADIYDNDGTTVVCNTFGQTTVCKVR